MMWFASFFPILIPGLHTGFLSGLIFITSLSLLLIIFIINFLGKTKKSISKHSIYILFILILSFSLILVSLLLSGHLLSVESNHLSSQRYLYLARSALFFLVFFFMVLCLEAYNKDSREVLSQISRLVIIIALTGVLMEVFSKYFGFDVVSFYKSRQDIGGWNSYHYDRLSGFFSYPGDLAAVLVLAISLLGLTRWSKCLKNIVFVIILISLFYTQSRAGLLLLFFVLVLYSISSFKSFILSFLSLLLIFPIFYFFREHFFSYFEQFDYLLRFFYEIDYYLERSKRAVEIIGIFSASLEEFFFGLNHKNIQSFYESEWAGSVARVGIIGSTWLIIVLIISVRLYMLSFSHASEPSLKLACSFLLCYIIFYCVGSAGISRAKIGLIYVVVLSVFYYLLISRGKDSLKAKGSIDGH